MFKKPDEPNWSYINYLQIKDIIILPALNIPEDAIILEQIKEYFPEYAAGNKIEQVDVSELVKEDGVLNCATWAVIWK